MNAVAIEKSQNEFQAEEISNGVSVEPRVAQVRNGKQSVVRNKKFSVRRFLLIGSTVTVSSLVVYHIAIVALINSLNLMPY